jgi:hypothetical protein
MSDESAEETCEEPAPKPRGRPFAKGDDERRAIGKGGRPKDAGFTARAKAATNDGQTLIDFWVETMTNSDDERNRLKASELLAQRAFGMPLQKQVNYEGQGDPMAEKSPEEVIELVERVQKELH